MLEPHTARGVVYFEPYEVDLCVGDVLRYGHRIRLQEQPFRVLQILLEHPGRVVTREQLQKKISDHGIKPLRENESHMAHRDHAGTTPIIAKHDFEDGDDVPGVFIAMGPGIKKGVRIMGLSMSVFDIAPTILHVYGLPTADQMRGRALTEIFEGSSAGSELSANR